MDDTLCRDFFTNLTNPNHRQYEALRAVFLEGRSQKDVAQDFGYQYSTLRQMVYQFRQFCHGQNTTNETPFFNPLKSAGRPKN